MKITNCKGCGKKKLSLFLNLNYSPPSNQLKSHKQIHSEEVYYPLSLVICNDCKLIQLSYHLDGDRLFKSNYPYFSSVSRLWLKHCDLTLKHLHSKRLFNSQSKIIELASNDGYLQDIFKSTYGLNIIGVEPTKLARELAKSKGHKVHNFFFDYNTSDKLKKKYGQFDLIIALNVFAHIPDLYSFIKGIKNLLSSKGKCMIEIPYFFNTFKNSLYDTIYHEHYYYYTIESLKNILSIHKLNFYDCEIINTHGGSLRVYLSKNQKLKESKKIKELLFKERKMSLNKIKFLKTFQNKVDIHSSKFISFLEKNYQKNQTIVGVAAAAKCSTILNYCGISSRLIKCVSDGSASKIGKFIPGTNIPIFSLKKTLSIRPDIIIIFAWNIFDELKFEINKNLKKYKYQKLPIIISVRDKKFI